MSLEATSSVLGAIMISLTTLIVVNLTTIKEIGQVCLIGVTLGYTAWKWWVDYQRSKKGE